METIDLYRNYLAQTAIFKALKRAGNGLYSGGFTVRTPGFEGGWDAQRVENGIRSAKPMYWLDAPKAFGFSITTSAINIYAKGWTSTDTEERHQTFCRLWSELPGPKAVLLDDQEKGVASHIIAGILHGTTYTIRVGTFPEAAL